MIVNILSDLNRKRSRCE